MQEVKAKLEATAREMRRTGLTKDEVGGLQPDVNTYHYLLELYFVFHFFLFLCPLCLHLFTA